MKKDILQQFCDTGLFFPLDIHFARFIQRLAQNNAPEISLAALLVSRKQRDGHICADLSEAAGSAPDPENPDAALRYPPLKTWLEALKSSGVAGSPGDITPLILDSENRLYLHRYWEYQDELARNIRERVQARAQKINMDRDGLERLFPRPENAASGETDWQKMAAFTALTRRFCVISGGPGTGKTTTVAKILALLLEQAEKKQPRIFLAAPTGKAAARLQEAIFREKAKLDSPVRDNIPADASTIHRLLGAIPDSPYFRHNERNLLPADVVVVDEASMVDIALMAKLVRALPPSARLVFLGDRDQLASVEAGAVLGDICDTGNIHRFSPDFCHLAQTVAGSGPDCPADDGPVPAICDAIIQLRKSYRFDSGGNIGHLGRAVVSGDDDALSVLAASDGDSAVLRRLPEARELGTAIGSAVIGGFGKYLECMNDPARAFQAFERFRILCALRVGPYGAVEINRLVEALLEQAGLIRPEKEWYAGRPVIITRNDYHLRLFNGDTGLVLPDPEAGYQERVFFREEGGRFRKLNPVRLPAHETVYAMTVHKSQGSEFDRILLMLPDRDNPVLTRELVYTGITRAIHRVEIWTRETVFREAVRRPIRRTSGLRDALWEKK